MGWLTEPIVGTKKKEKAYQSEWGLGHAAVLLEPIKEGAPVFYNLWNESQKIAYRFINKDPMMFDHSAVEYFSVAVKKEILQTLFYAALRDYSCKSIAKKIFFD